MASGSFLRPWAAGSAAATESENDRKVISLENTQMPQTWSGCSTKVFPPDCGVKKSRNLPEPVAKRSHCTTKMQRLRNKRSLSPTSQLYSFFAFFLLSSELRGTPKKKRKKSSASQERLRGVKFRSRANQRHSQETVGLLVERRRTPPHNAAVCGDVRCCASRLKTKALLYHLQKNLPRSWIFIGSRCRCGGLTSALVFVHMRSPDRNQSQRFSSLTILHITEELHYRTQSLFSFQDSQVNGSLVM